MGMSSRRSPVASALVARVGAVPLGCLIGVVLLLGVGGVTWHTSTTYGHLSHAALAAAGPQDVGVVPVAAPSTPAPDVPVSPTRIEIPALKAVAPIVDVATTPDGELDVPLNPKVVGWWSPGARPGAKVGTAILAGHINYSGVDGTLGKIGTLKQGDIVKVFGTVDAGDKREVSFKVTGVRTYHKTHLPYQQIFDQKSVGRIAIVTCGGPFDNSTGNYLDNVVVFAVPFAAT